MAFDIDGALRAGYSVTDILNFLSEKEGFDLAGAREAGYSDSNILFELAKGKPKTTAIGQAKEFVKGIPSGAVGLLETAGVGASAILPEEYEKPVREAIQSGAATLKKPFAPARGYEESIPRKFGEAVGSTGPFFATGPFGFAGRAAGFGLAGSAGAGEARLRAEEAGATEGERAGATVAGTAVGFTEMLPVFRFIEALGTPFKKEAITIIRRAAATGGAEGAQEAAAQIAQNLIAKGIYNPEQSFIAGAGEEGAYGAGTGVLIQALTDMALGRRASTSSGAQPTTAPAPTAPAPTAPGAPLLPAPYTEGAPRSALPDTYAQATQEVERLKRMQQTDEVTERIAQLEAYKRRLITDDIEGMRRQPMTEPTSLEDQIRNQSQLQGEFREMLDLPTREATPEPEVTAEAEKEIPTVLDANTLSATGLPKQSGFYKQLLGKDLTNLEDLDTVLQLEKRVANNKSISPDTKAALNTLVTNAFNLYGQQAEMFGPRGGVLEPAKEPKAPKATPAQKKISEVIEGKDLSDPAQVDQISEVLEDYANDPIRNAQDVAEIDAFLDSIPSPAPEATDVIESGEPVGGTSEPRPVVAEQRGEVPAGRTEAPESDRVGDTGQPVGEPVAGEAVQPPALTESEDTGYVGLRDAIDRLIFEGGMRRADAVEEINNLSNSFGDVSKEDLDAAIRRARTNKPKYRPKVEGRGVSAERVRKLVERIVSRWKNAPRIEVVQSVNELPDYLQEDIARDQVTPPGAFDPDTETVFLIADNITGDMDAALTLAHEALGHYGLRSILGGGYTKMMNDVYNGNAKVRAEADKKIAAGLDKETAVEEVLAEMAERGVSNNAIQRVLNAIRQFFRRIGMDFRAVTDAEVRELLTNARRFVREGAPKAEGTAAFRGRPLYRASREETLTPEGERAAALNERLKGISNPSQAPEVADNLAKSLLGKMKFFDRKEGDPGLFTKFRQQVADKDAPVIEKLRAAFDNAVTNALGDIRGDLLAAQAQDHAAVTSEVLTRGGIRIGKDGLAEVYDDPDNMQNVFDLVVNKLGKKLGSAKLAMNLAHNAGIARRADGINKFNAEQEAKAEAAEKKGNKAAAQKLRDQKVTVRASQEEIDAGLEALNTYPEIREALEMFDRFNSRLIDFLVESGRINEGTAQNWKANTGYVPWTRVEEEVGMFEETPMRGKVGIVNLSKLPILDKQGSDKEISNIFDNMMGHTGWVVRTGLMARAANKMASQLPDAKELKTDDELQAELKKNRARVIFTYKDGERTPYLLGSAYDVPTFSIAPDISLGVLKPLEKSASILRDFVTHMPAFALGQLIQDGTYRAALLSGVNNPFGVSAKVFRNFYEIVTGKKGVAADIAALGITGVYDGMPEDVIKRARERFGVEEASRGRKIWQGLEKFSLAADLAVRAAIYEQTMQETNGDRALAMYRAKEYINFKRAGSNTAVRGLRRLVPFMNAYIQGMDVLQRTMRGKGVSTAEKNEAMRLFWMTGLKLAALNTIYTMLVSDDDEYQGLEDYERFKNYIIPGTGVKIPVAPEVGFLFKVIPELTVNYVLREGTDRPMDAATVRKAFTDAFANAYGGVNLTPQLIKPALEVAVNYSFFTGSPIIGQSMPKEAELQFNSSTSELSKLVGSLTGLSPMKMDYMIRGYTGMLGAIVLDVTDAVANPDRMEKPIYKLPQVSTFMYDPTGRGYKSEFYNFREEVTKVVDAVNMFKREGRAEELEKYLDEDKLRLYAMKGVVTKISDTMGQLRRQRAIIANDPSLTGEEKRAMTDDILAYEKEILLAYNVPQLRKMTKE